MLSWAEPGGRLTNKRFEERAAELARLPRAERFEQLIEFPTRHLFKVIGPREGLHDAVHRLLQGLGFPDVIIVERPSAGGRHASLTFELSVSSGQELDQIYIALEGVRGVAYVF